jgi:hypothetical protein
MRFRCWPGGVDATQVLAPPQSQVHMWAMSGRPCNPGNDFKRLWQTFLGNTPMPQCGTPSDPQTAEASKTPAPDPAPAKQATDG